MTKLTRTLCGELVRQKRNRQAVIWDDDVPGFGIRVSQGGSASFVLKYRVQGDALQRFITLGPYPTLHPEKARDEAREIKVGARLGRDIWRERLAAIQAAEAEREVAKRRGILASEMLDGFREQTQRRIAEAEAAGTAATYEAVLLRLEAKVLRPAIGHLGVPDVTGDLLQALISSEESLSTARNLRGLIVRVARRVNTEMARRGMPDRWLVAYELPRGRRPTRDHRYSLAEMGRLWMAAGSMGRRGALVRLMMLTGCRRSDAQRVRWEHIDLDDPVIGPHWTQPGKLTKTYQSHRVPLGAPAVALLRWLPPRETKKSGDTELIFAGRGNRPIGDWTSIRRTLLERAKVPDGTLHDFRRTIVSTLGDRGFDPQVADGLLNHAAGTTMGGVMAVYQRSDLWAKRREAIDLWCGLLMEAAGEGALADFDQPFTEARIVRPKTAPPPVRRSGASLRPLMR